MRHLAYSNRLASPNRPNYIQSANRGNRGVVTIHQVISNCFLEDGQTVTIPCTVRQGIPNLYELIIIRYSKCSYVGEWKLSLVSLSSGI